MKKVLGLLFVVYFGAFLTRGYTRYIPTNRENMLLSSIVKKIKAKGASRQKHILNILTKIRPEILGDERKLYFVDTLIKGLKGYKIGYQIPVVHHKVNTDKKVITDKRRAKKLSLGPYSSCALLNNGDVTCFQYYGKWVRKGFSHDHKAIDLVNVPGKDGAKIQCALLENGNVVCFGDKDSFNVYKGYKGGDAKKLFVGENHSCVIRDSGQVACWGDEDKWKDGFYEGNDVKKLALTWNQTCFLLNNGNIRCAGRKSSDTFFRHDKGQAVDIVSGRKTTCALFKNGNASCRDSQGINTNYSKGDMKLIKASTLWGACGITKKGNILCWEEDLEKPGGIALFDVYTGGNAVSFDGDKSSGCAVLSNGNVKCWKSKNSTVSDALVFDYKGGNAKQVSVKQEHVCILFNDGSIHCEAQDAHSKTSDYRP